MVFLLGGLNRVSVLLTDLEATALLEMPLAPRHTLLIHPLPSQQFRLAMASVCLLGAIVPHMRAPSTSAYIAGV